MKWCYLYEGRSPAALPTDTWRGRLARRLRLWADWLDGRQSTAHRIARIAAEVGLSPQQAAECIRAGLWLTERAICEAVRAEAEERAFRASCPELFDQGLTDRG